MLSAQLIRKQQKDHERRFDLWYSENFAQQGDIDCTNTSLRNAMFGKLILL